MRARVVIEVDPEGYDTAIRSPTLALSVAEVEVRQAEGLLNETRGVLLIEGIGAAARKEAGVDDALPAARFYMRETDGPSRDDG